MAHSDISPGFVIIKYSFNANPHTMTLPVKPSGGVTPGTEPDFETTSGITAMSGAVDNLVTAMLPLWSASVDVISAEMWSKPTPADNPIWIFTHPINEPGTGGGASVDWNQQVITFRTSNGGILKHQMMALIDGTAMNTREPFPFVNGASNAIANYLTGIAGWVIGRDGGFPVVPVWRTTKINDAIRKRILHL